MRARKNILVVDKRTMNILGLTVKSKTHFGGIMHGNSNCTGRMAKTSTPVMAPLQLKRRHLGRRNNWTWQSVQVFHITSLQCSVRVLSQISLDEGANQIGAEQVFLLKVSKAMMRLDRGLLRLGWNLQGLYTTMLHTAFVLVLWPQFNLTLGRLPALVCLLNLNLILVAYWCFLELPVLNTVIRHGNLLFWWIRYDTITQLDYFNLFLWQVTVSGQRVSKCRTFPYLRLTSERAEIFLNIMTDLMQNCWVNHRLLSVSKLYHACFFKPELNSSHQLLWSHFKEALASVCQCSYLLDGLIPSKYH